jgi:EmrB/QacA subfamily drug resistance transporter
VGVAVGSSVTGAVTAGPVVGTLNRGLALLVAGTFFMENLDGTIVATAAPAIARDLGVAPVDVNLVMTSYLVSVAVGIPLSGWLADRFGGRRVFLLAIAVFTLASAGCAVSTSLPALCALRVLQGLGGAMMVPVGRLVVLRATAKRDLLDAIAYLTWPALVAPVIAPFVGGWLSTYASWRWIFLINIPLGVVAVVVAVRVVPLVPGVGVGPLDRAGFLLSGITLVALLLGVEGVGQRSTGAAVVVLLVVAAGAGVLTVRHMRRVPHPLLDLAALRVRTFRVANASGMVYRMAISAVPFVLPLMFQLAFHWSAVRSGLMVMAVFVGNVSIKPATSPLIRRFGFRRIIVASSLGGALLFGACAFLRPSTPAVVIAAVLLASGAMRSLGFSAYNSLMFADVSAPQMSAANTLSSTIGQLAAGLGVAVGALALRVSEGALDTLVPGHGVVLAYHVTFGLLALMMLYPVVEGFLGLDGGAGGEVVSRR